MRKRTILLLALVFGLLTSSVVGFHNAKAQLNVQVDSTPSCPATVLVNQPVAFTATPLDGRPPYTYQGYVVSMPQSVVDRVRGATASTFRFTESTPGTYLISVAITDSSGSGVYASYPRTGGLSVDVQESANPPPPSSSSAAENRWVSKAPMNEKRAYLGVAVVNGKIYAIGGDDGGYTKRLSDGGTATTRTYNVVNTNEEYDPANDTWTFKSPMPTSRAGFATTVYQNKIYCIGGWTTGFLNTTVNEAYYPTTDSWETKAPLLTPSALLTGNVVNGQIYVLPVGSTGPVEVYNPKTDSWISKTTPPYQVTGFATAVIGEKIYFEASIVNMTVNISIEIYDIVRDSWEVVSTSLFSSYHLGNGGITSGIWAPLRMYFFVNDATNVYDPANDQWIVGASMSTPRYCVGVAVVNDTFYIIGGRTRMSGLLMNVFITMSASPATEQYIPFGYGSIRPLVSVVSPMNETYNESSVPLTFTVDKPASLMEYSLDGQGNVSVPGNTTLTGLLNGAHNLTVFAKYTEGSINSSEPINFTINQPASFTTTETVAAITLIVGIAGGIYFIKKKH